MNTPPVRILTLTVAIALAAIASERATAAGKTVPGERWQQKITMQMQGMSMPVGGSEVCAPVGKASAELAKPDKNCTISNVKQAGNRFSADVKCTGKDAMEGTIEETVEGDHISGRMNMKSAEGEMTMVMDSKKLGACQAVDVEDMVAASKAQGAAATASAANATADMCRKSLADLKKNPGQAGAVAALAVRDGGPCVTKPVNPEFCAAIQTRSGFSSLTGSEAALAGITAKSLAACNLGQGKAAVDALRAKLVTSAVTDGDTSFLIANDPAKARELARTQCVLKGEMWAGRTSKLDTFCDSNFAEDARRGK